MVGCDLCDDWYHLQCIGITQSQADKTDKYNCLRCTLRLSIKSSTKQVGDLANFWMVPDEYLRIRDGKKQKISKKLLKEEKEVFRLQQSTLDEKLAEENKLLKKREDNVIINSSSIDVITTNPITNVITSNLITNDSTIVDTGDMVTLPVDVISSSNTITTISSDQETTTAIDNSTIETPISVTPSEEKSIYIAPQSTKAVVEMKIRLPVEIELDDAKKSMY
jgi:hypothetical protein